MSVDYTPVLFVGIAYDARALFVVGRGCECGKTQAGKYCPECGGKVEKKYLPGPLIEDDPDGGYKMKCGLDLFSETYIKEELKDDYGTAYVGARLRSSGETPEDIVRALDIVRLKLGRIKEFAGLPVKIYALQSIG